MADLISTEDGSIVSCINESVSAFNRPLILGTIVAGTNELVEGSSPNSGVSTSVCKGKLVAGHSLANASFPSGILTREGVKSVVFSSPERELEAIQLVDGENNIYLDNPEDGEVLLDDVNGTRFNNECFMDNGVRFSEDNEETSSYFRNELTGGRGRFASRGRGPHHGSSSKGGVHRFSGQNIGQERGKEKGLERGEPFSLSQQAVNGRTTTFQTKADVIPVFVDPGSPVAERVDGLLHYPKDKSLNNIAASRPQTTTKLLPNKQKVTTSSPSYLSPSKGNHICPYDEVECTNQLGAANIEGENVQI